MKYICWNQYLHGNYAFSEKNYSSLQTCYVWFTLKCRIPHWGWVYMVLKINQTSGKNIPPPVQHFVHDTKLTVRLSTELGKEFLCSQLLAWSVMNCLFPIWTRSNRVWIYWRAALHFIYTEYNKYTDRFLKNKVYFIFTTVTLLSFQQFLYAWYHIRPKDLTIIFFSLQ